MSDGWHIDQNFIWWMVPKVVCTFYLVSFLSLRNQVLPWIGSRGVSPIRFRLDAVRRHYFARRFFHKPSVFWINSSDTFIQGVVYAGCCAALLGIFGDFWWAYLICWMCYLSLQDAALIYPWDCLLLESGFLLFFSPSVALVVVAWKLLLLRVIWGFARKKFVGGSKNNTLYLRGFLTWMPLPNPISWWLQKAPNAVLVAFYIVIFLAEVVAPGFAFFSSDLRFIAFFTLSALMLGIAATGNWGFFNGLYLGLCLVFLDPTWGPLDFSSHVFTNSAMLVLIVGGVVYSLGNSWTTGCIVYLITDDAKLKKWAILRAILEFYRALVPFRVLHSYGVFPADSIAPIRHVVVFEGSDDGNIWKPYEYRYAPSHEKSVPKFAAPHHPRLDHLICYAGFGATFADFFSSVLAYLPYNDLLGSSRYSWMHLLMQRLLEGEPQVATLFKNNPFPHKPPVYVRVATHFVTPASLDEWRADRSYWKREFSSVAILPQKSNPQIWRHHVAPPELLHPMQGYWKQRAANAARCDEDMSRFRSDYVSFLKKCRHGDWSRVEYDEAAFREKFTLSERDLFERILARETFEIFERCEHLHKNKYQLHLVCQDLVLSEVAVTSEEVCERLQNTSASELLYVLAVMRFEEVRTFTIFMHATKWIKQSDKSLDPFFKVLLAKHVFAREITLPTFHGSDVATQRETLRFCFSDSAVSPENQIVGE